MRARSQVYAETILGMINVIQGETTGVQKRYGALCYRFPFMVRENGLAAALGFLAGKGGGDTESAEMKLLNDLTQVLGAADSTALQQTVITSGLPEYRHVTLKALAAAEWFKRYAEAVLKVDVTGHEEDENA